MGDDLSRIQHENEQRFVLRRRQADLRGPYQKFFNADCRFTSISIANLQSPGNTG